MRVDGKHFSLTCDGVDESHEPAMRVMLDFLEAAYPEYRQEVLRLFSEFGVRGYPPDEAEILKSARRVIEGAFRECLRRLAGTP